MPVTTLAYSAAVAPSVKRSSVARCCAEAGFDYAAYQDLSAEVYILSEG